MKSFIKKNIFNSLVLLSGTLLIFTGCEKSFLKADPLSFYEPEQTYSTESGLKSVLAIADRQLKRYYTTGGDDLFPLVWVLYRTHSALSKSIFMTFDYFAVLKIKYMAIFRLSL